MEFELDSAKGVILYRTQAAQQLVERISEAQTAMLNRNRIVGNGFQVDDYAELASDNTFNNLNMTEFVLKLTFLIRMSNQTPSALSNAAFYGPVENADPNTALATPLNVVRGVNDAPAFGESCGGTAAVFPVGGSTGSLYFHYTMDSVPPEMRSQVVVAPRGIVNMCTNPWMAIAAIVAGFSPWPHNVTTYTVDTTDAAGNNPGGQVFIPNDNTCIIPGMTEIHVLLSLNTRRSKPPDSQEKANGMVDQQPRTGPNASATYAANQYLNVSYLNNLVEHNLAEFLYTWTNNTDGGWQTATLVNILFNINAVVPILDTLDTCLDLHSFGTVRYPYMVSGQYGTQHLLSGDSEAGFLQQLADGRPATQTTVDWPQTNAGQGVSVYIGETMPRAWSKVWIGAYRCEEVARSHEMPYELNHPASQYFALLRGRRNAAAFQMADTLLSLTVGAWNQALYQTDSEAMRGVVRMHYAQGCVEQRVNTAQFGTWTQAISEHYCGSSFASATGQNALPEVLAPPATAKTGIWDADNSIELTEVLPARLPDIWLYMAVDDVPRGMAPFPPGYKRFGLTGLAATTGQYRELKVGRGTWYSLWLPAHEQTPQLGIDELPVYNDDIFWDRRFARHTGIHSSSTNRGVIERYYDGTAVTGTVPVGALVCQRQISPPLTLPTGIEYKYQLPITASTMWIAQADENGTRFWSMWSASTAQLQNREMMGIVPGYIDTWQMGNAIVPPGVLVGNTPDGLVWTNVYTALLSSSPAKKDFQESLPSTGESGQAAVKDEPLITE
jgi:hypothetical protein